MVFVVFDRPHDFLLVFLMTTSLSCTVSEILFVISKKFMRSRDPEHIYLGVVYHANANSR